MVPRQAAFTAEYMEARFGEAHRFACGRDSPVPRMGYPDQGSGLYSKQLPYKQWYELNVAQRIHNNSLEHLSWVMPLLLVGGVFNPRWTASAAGVVLVGRELYRFGYLSKHGPNSTIREAGAIPLNAAELSMIGALGLVYLKHRAGPFFARRKIVQRFTKTHYDKKYAEVMEEIKNPRPLSYYMHRKQRSLLPFDPRIKQQEFEKRQEENRPLPGELSPAERKRRTGQAKLPDIKYYM